MPISLYLALAFSARVGVWELSKLLYTFSSLFSRTLTTATGTVMRSNDNIIPSQSMAIFTMRFTRMLRRRANTTQNINFLGHMFNVNRIYAGTMSTKMVGFPFWWNNLYEKLVHESVHSLNLAAISNFCISIWVYVALPFPTSNALVKMQCADLDPGKDAIKKFSVYGQSIRIGSSHFGFISNMKLMWLGLRRLFAQSIGPFFILPKLTFEFNLLEVCYRYPR